MNSSQRINAFLLPASPRFFDLYVVHCEHQDRRIARIAFRWGAASGADGKFLFRGYFTLFHHYGRIQDRTVTDCAKSHSLDSSHFVSHALGCILLI
jgi:hypothetical protein